MASFASSYIKTEDTTVTRPADTLTIPQVGDRRRGFICWQGVMRFDPEVSGTNLVRPLPFGRSTTRQGVRVPSISALQAMRAGEGGADVIRSAASSLQQRLVRVAYYWDQVAGKMGMAVDGLSNEEAGAFDLPLSDPVVFGQSAENLQGSSHTDWIFISYQIPPIAQIEALTGGVL